MFPLSGSFLLCHRRTCIDLFATRMPEDLRGLPGPSAGASGSTARSVSSVSHVLTIDGYSKTKKMFCPGDSIESEYFGVVGGHPWYIQLYPSRVKEDDDILLSD
ncbi:uncharacterized protein LOC8068312 [Sorghum bicolor]|uniref:uncharacterized protein LOC8068312 n=1 Tax=Sorghum bicolor TaxID=4558 RepID=UPI000B424425|nr:uncharacterized protein LOC8068312 [Sorghum bicolor]|eukprot:XP_021316857.1 uncharacterized protein LOC8068312 [Sorghum bicolor]